MVCERAYAMPYDPHACLYACLYKNKASLHTPVHTPVLHVLTAAAGMLLCLHVCMFPICPDWPGPRDGMSGRRASVSRRPRGGLNDQRLPEPLFAQGSIEHSMEHSIEHSIAFPSCLCVRPHLSGRLLPASTLTVLATLFGARRMKSLIERLIERSIERALEC